MIDHTARSWGSGAEGTTWLLRHGAELWLPTPAEQDARYEQVYGEQERQAARHRQVATYTHMLCCSATRAGGWDLPPAAGSAATRGPNPSLFRYPPLGR